MVELGRFAAKLERAAMAAEASGLAAPKKNELRSERWFETDALGRSVKNVFVDAVNVARPYEREGGGGERTTSSGSGLRFDRIIKTRKKRHISSSARDTEDETTIPGRPNRPPDWRRPA
jgi:hypothetical protein